MVFEETGVSSAARFCLCVLVCKQCSDSLMCVCDKALALCEICKRVPVGLFDQDAEEMLLVILSALRGKTWPGKDHFLFATAAILKVTPKLVTLPVENPVAIEKVVASLLESAKRNDAEYSLAALKAFAEVLQLIGRNFSARVTANKLIQNLLDAAKASTVCHTISCTRSSFLFW